MGVVAWQGWRIELPERWSPVKLEGDSRSGYAAFADLHRPRLAMRWHTPRPSKRFDPGRWIDALMMEEVGRLAFEESRPHDLGPFKGRLFIEPEPPGRDVWIGHDAATGRAIQIVHQARRRERMLVETILPTLRELPLDQPMPWAIFELSCIVPEGMKLESQQLNAGDLSLSFAGKGRRQLTVRQVAVAGLALQRKPLEKWLTSQQWTMRKHYRAVSEVEPVETPIDETRKLSGFRRAMRRRRRFFFLRHRPPWYVMYALHDAARDRLVLVQGTDEAMVVEATRSVGWARMIEA